MILVFVAGLGCGYFARDAADKLRRTTHATDLAAIEKLNQEDIDATLVQDPKRLIDLRADDAVAFYAGSPPAVGKQAIGAHNERFHAQYPGLKVLSYTSKYKKAWHAVTDLDNPQLNCQINLRLLGTRVTRLDRPRSCGIGYSGV
ncbi:MAG: hypothetical protein HY820_27045 [Acidobacteria bacterium]|nr:hypothetical protein [Acidobacteriota bacterium]